LEDCRDDPTKIARIPRLCKRLDLFLKKNSFHQIQIADNERKDRLYEKRRTGYENEESFMRKRKSRLYEKKKPVALLQTGSVYKQFENTRAYLY
jgi:hypothetical protein